MDKYEKFEPMEVFYDTQAIKKVWSIGYRNTVSIIKSDRNTSKIVFCGANVSTAYLFWKVEAVVTFRESRRTLPVLVENVICDVENPYHQFDSRILNGLEEEDLLVTIQLKELTGFGLKPRPYDYYSPSAETDVILTAGSRKFFESKQILAYHSPYFKNLFFGEHAALNKEKVELTDIRGNHLVELLDAMHGSHLMRSDYVEKILEYADRFDVAEARKNMELFLMFHKRTCKYEKLLLSEKYRLPQLQDKVLSSWTAEDNEQLLSGKDDFLKKISDQLILVIVKRGWNAGKQ